MSKLINEAKRRARRAQAADEGQRRHQRRHQGRQVSRPVPWWRAPTARRAFFRRMTDSPATRPPRCCARDVHGVLLLDKPLGLSSNDALVRAKRPAARAIKAGHTRHTRPACYRPAAAVCSARPTKFSQDLLDADKTLRGRGAIRVTTTTGDAEGEVAGRTRGATATARRVEAAMTRFTGTDRTGAADVLGPQEGRRGRAMNTRAPGHTVRTRGAQ